MDKSNLELSSPVEDGLLVQNLPTNTELMMETGYRSRKFFLTILSVLILVLFSLMSIWFTAVAAILPSFIGGLLGILSLYFTGNVANKYVLGKVINNSNQIQATNAVNKTTSVPEVVTKPENAVADKVAEA